MDRSKTRIAVVGCTGRMGQACIRLVAASDRLTLVAALTAAGDPHLGKDAGATAAAGELGVRVHHVLESTCDVLVDFSTPVATQQWAGIAADHGVAFVSGTTGLSESQHQALRSAAARVPVIWAPNMSVGVNLLIAAVEDVSRRLGDAWEIEIVEAHHHHKADAPSGTAKALLEAACRGRGVSASDVAIYGRSGDTGKRPRGEIGVHAVRMGDVIGDHDVHFAGAGEVVTLRHRALSRDIFAAGALRAAAWIHGRPAGLFTMRDVLFS